MCSNLACVEDDTDAWRVVSLYIVLNFCIESKLSRTTYGNDCLKNRRVVHMDFAGDWKMDGAYGNNVVPFNECLQAGCWR